MGQIVLRLGAGGLLIMAMCAPFARASETRGLDPGKGVTQLGLESWTTDQGLPNATVNTALQTRDGYLWLGTFDGLARFDGSRFTVFTQHQGLGSNGIRALAEDKAGRLWVGTSGGGLSCFTRDGLTRLSASQGLPSDSIRSLLVDGKSGALWVGTNGGGLARVADGKVETLPAESGHVVNALGEETDGTLWIAAESEGLRRRRPDGRFDSFGVDLHPALRFVNSVTVARDDSVWVATSGGGVLHLARGQLVPLPPPLHEIAEANVSCVLEDRMGTIWIGTNGRGLGRLARGELSWLGAAEGLGDVVYSLSEDREGSLFIGTNGAGVSQLRDGSFTAYGTREGLSRDFVYTALEDPSGVLWAGTGSGLDRKVGDRFVPVRSPVPSPVGVRSLASGPDGALWAGTYGQGVWRLLDGAWRVSTVRDGLASDSVRAVLCDRAGRLWAATVAGLSVLEKGSWRTYRRTDGLSRDSLIALAEDGAGALWIGTDGGGVCRMKDGRFDVYTVRDGLASDLVLALFVDGKGVLWVGTNGGLSRFTGERFASLTSSAGLPSDSVTQIQEDAAGDLWLGTSRGVSRVKRASLFSGGNLDVETFDRADGLRSSQCTAPGQPAGSKTRDGHLWFATTRGLVTVDPSRSFHDPFPPPVAIEEALIDGRTIPTSGAFVVPPGRVRIEIRYAVLSFRATSRVSVRFRLDGFDSSWVDAGDRRRADYTGVPPGSYTFRVSARRPDGPWSPGASLAMRVEPRFFETRSFVALVVLLLVGSVVGGHFLHVRQLRSRERELTALVAERAGKIVEEKTRAETALAENRRQSDYLASLHETSLAMMNRLELDTLLETLVVRAAALLSAPNGFLYLETEDRARLECRVWIGSRPRDQYAAPDEGAVGRAWTRGRPLLVEDYDTWAGRSPQVPPKTFGSMLAVPLRVGGRVAGALGLARDAGHGSAFGKAELSILVGYGQLASIALENARLYGAARDELVERQRTEEALRESEQRFRQLAENIDAIFFIRSLNPPRILYVSPSYERIWGRSRELLYADPRALLDGVHPADREEVLRHVGGGSEGYEMEFRVVRPDGSIRMMHTRAFPVRGADGRVERIAGIAEDITVRKEVEVLRRSLMHAVVHDLKNPLSAILGSLDFLGSERLTADDWSILRVAQSSAKRLLAMVETILDVARLEVGSMPVERETLDLVNLVDEALSLQRPLADPRKLTLTRKAPKGLPKAFADRALTARILQNLVGNAIKFTPPEGEVTVSVAAGSDGHVEITVSDTGAGVPPEMKERLFQKFAAGKQAGRGTGLGLSFCRLAVEAQGGTIVLAESEVGARFVFTLPATS